MVKKKNNYIDNNEFKEELVKWRDSAEDPDARMPSERLGQILVALHDGVLKHKNFNGYRSDLKDEMKSYSLYRILKNGLKTYNFSQSPFSYFTRAAFLNYMTVIMRYYTQLNRHQEYVKGMLTHIDTAGCPAVEKFISTWSTSR